LIIFLYLPVAVSLVGYQIPWYSQSVAWASPSLNRCLNIWLTKEWASPAASLLACTCIGRRCIQIFDLKWYFTQKFFVQCTTSKMYKHLEPKIIQTLWLDHVLLRCFYFNC